MLWLGIVLALVTSASWAMGNVLTQRVGKLVGPPRAMLWSMAAGGALALPCALLFDTRSAPLTAAVAGWIAAAAISGLVAYVGLFVAFANEKLTIAVPLVSSWPLVTGVVSVTLLGETLQGKQALGAGVVLAGVLLVSVAPAKKELAAEYAAPTSKKEAAAVDAPSTSSRRGFYAALASSLGFGVMVPAMARIAPAVGAFGATTIVYVLGIALAVGIGGVAGVSLRSPPRAAWGIVLGTGAAETIGFVTVALARRFAPMSLVAPVASLSATMTVLYAWVVMKERPRPLAMAGALLAGAGVVFLGA